MTDCLDLLKDSEESSSFFTTNDEFSSPQQDVVLLPIQGREFRFGNIVFTSMFDSGNLDRVEKVIKDSTSTDKPGYLDPVADSEFNLWTRPDCFGTQYENSNRTWFYFGIKGYAFGKLFKLNIMNLNKQSKLYSQGFTPLCRIVPQRPTWERLKERCTYECNGSDFVLTFHYRFPDYKGTVYFAFSYPWSYTESLQQMSNLDLLHHDSDLNIHQRNEEEIYFHRELLVKSLDGLRVDLLTISSFDGITEAREPRFDSHLFPDQSIPRCRNFSGKKVFMLTSRVHPGETPASSVFNGFLNFILRKDDRRAIELRKKYVFKLIPMLNPDGVVRGHYRTDSRGVNLNRYYLNPDKELHPSIYATKSLLVFHHINNCAAKGTNLPDITVIFKDLTAQNAEVSNGAKPVKFVEDTQGEVKSIPDIVNMMSPDLLHGINQPDVVHILHSTKSPTFSSSLPPITGVEHLNHPFLKCIPANESGVGFYVDLHGHASKRGCFMYGNHFTEEEHAVSNLLYPKLISMNCAHFDYGGCNFTEKNMYAKDKHDSHSKEGSGRVAIYKALGIIHSYTLECNYNCGRLVNSLANTPNDRITPPLPAGFPPKFTQAHFEEVGRGVAIAVLDYIGANPCSRIQYTELPTVQSVKEWVRRSLINGACLPKYSKPATSINPKAIYKNVGSASAKSEPIVKRKNELNSQSSTDISVPIKNGFTFGKTLRFNSEQLQQNAKKKTEKQSEPMPTVKRSFSLPASTMNKFSEGLKLEAKSLGDITHTRSYSLRLMHTLSRQNNTTVNVMKSRLTEQSQGEDAISSVPTQDKNLLNSVTPKRKDSVLDLNGDNHLRPASKINVYIKDDKRTNNPTASKLTSRILDRAKQLGLTFSKGPPGIVTKQNNMKTNKSVMQTAGKNQVLQTNLKGNILYGDKAELKDKLKDAEKLSIAASNKKTEVDVFEKKLRDRVSKLDHSASFWIEL